MTEDVKTAYERDIVETVSPLWTFANKVREILDGNPDTAVGVDIATKTIFVDVMDEKRWRALNTLLPHSVEFPDGTLTINVELKHFGGENYLPDTVFEAFQGNPKFHYMHEWNDPEATNNPFCWVCIEPDALIYPESNLHQLYSDTAILRADAVHEVLSKRTDHIFYCVDSNKESDPRPIPENNSRKFN